MPARILIFGDTSAEAGHTFLHDTIKPPLLEHL